MFSMNAAKLLPWAPVAIRLGLAVIFIAHGGQKLFGIWGGPGLQATIEAFERSIGVPFYLTLIVVGTEFFGGLTVLIGFLTRLAAAGLAADMAGAIIKVHLVNGFFLNWSITPGKGHGYEFNLALLAMSIALLLSGPGKFALDRMLGLEQE
ncbi:MAG TPA: DoxX family protein [Candidatus Binatia bacterium]|nr:DoxX family protein [Candidatus Binatia bacterium]